MKRFRRFAAGITAVILAAGNIPAAAGGLTVSAADTETAGFSSAARDAAYGSIGLSYDADKGTLKWSVHPDYTYDRELRNAHPWSVLAYFIAEFSSESSDVTFRAMGDGFTQGENTEEYGSTYINVPGAAAVAAITRGKAVSGTFTPKMYVQPTDLSAGNNSLKPEDAVLSDDTAVTGNDGVGIALNAVFTEGYSAPASTCIGEPWDASVPRITITDDNPETVAYIIEMSDMKDFDAS